MLPRVRIVDTDVTAHGGGVFTVEAEIENSGFFPTSLQHGVVSRAVLVGMERAVREMAELVQSARTAVAEPGRWTPPVGF